MFKNPKIEYIESDSDEYVSNIESEFESDTHEIGSSEVNLSIGSVDQSPDKLIENNGDSKDLSPDSKMNKKLKKN